MHVLIVKTHTMKNKILSAGIAGLAVAAFCLSMSSCVSIPKGARAIRPFKKYKYLGTWYEIARMDFKFERDLEKVTANYSLKDDDVIKVVNRGYNAKKGEWKESIGKAKLVGDSTEARLKVSFFGPFYAGYNVIAIDPDYQYALVAGNNLKYLWLLSRDKTMPKPVIDQYLKKAAALGYNVKDLVWTRQ